MRPQAISAIIILLTAGIGLSLVGGILVPIHPIEQPEPPIAPCNPNCDNTALSADVESRTLDRRNFQTGLLMMLGAMFLVTMVYLRHSKSDREADLDTDN